MPKIVNREEMSSDLLMRAFTLFYQYGFHGTSMRDLASKLKISTGTLYHYFKDKDDLFEKMIVELSKSDILLGRNFLAEENSNFKKWQKFADFFQSKEEHFKMLIILLLDYQRKKRQSSNQLFKLVFDNYVKTIQTELKLDSAVNAEIFFNALIGFLVRQLIQPQKTDRSKISEYIKNLKLLMLGEKND